MNSFKNDNPEMPLSSVWLMNGISEYKGKQELYTKQAPQVLKTLVEMALIENLQRENLNAIEEAVGYAQLAEQFNLTQEEIATKVGKSRAAVANALNVASGFASYDDVTNADGSTAKHRHHRKAVNIMEAQLAANEVNKNHGLPENPLVPVTAEQIIQPLADVAQVLAQANLQNEQADAAERGEEATAGKGAKPNAGDDE